MSLTVTSSELRDSSHLADDWQALRRLIATDGYVFLRGLLDPTMVQAVGRDGLGHLQRAGWLSREPIPSPPNLAYPSGPSRCVTPSAMPGTAAILADPGFNRIPFAAPLAT